MSEIKRVWSDKKTTWNGKEQVWEKDGELKKYDGEWKDVEGNIEVYEGSSFVTLPGDAELDTYDTNTPSFIGTVEDGIEAAFIFKDWDDTVLKSGKVKDGGTPVPPANPTREATAQYTYTFSGWNPEVGPITKSTEYIAQYSSTVNQYTVTFVDEDGTTELDEQTLDYGATPVYAGETPTKESTAQYTYTFSGWTPAISTVTGNATYTATYEATPRNYTVTIEPNDDTMGSVTTESVVVAYGTAISASGTTLTIGGAECTATAETGYVFVSYNVAGASLPATVTGDLTITATFELVPTPTPTSPYDYIKGPCPSGYHVMATDDSNNLYTALVDLGVVDEINEDFTGYRIQLKMPLCGYLKTATDLQGQGTKGYWWTTECTTQGKSYLIGQGESLSGYTSRACNIRPFKNTPVVPDNSWTMTFDGSSVATGAGVFHNASLGLISLSSDGTNWITLADKNLGASVIYNQGDTLSQSNCGNFFQWGNNYAFTFGMQSNTSTTQVDASAYGPGNYYSSDVFISLRSSPWDSSINQNLWGDESYKNAQLPELFIDMDNSTQSDAGVDVLFHDYGQGQYAYETTAIVNGVLTNILPINADTSGDNFFGSGMTDAMGGVSAGHVDVVIYGTGKLNDSTHAMEAFSNGVTLHYSDGESGEVYTTDGQYYISFSTETHVDPEPEPPMEEPIE